MKSEFKILVDADGCPVVQIVSRLAKEYNIEAVFFCDIHHEIEVNYGRVQKITPGRDAVDFAMIGALKTGDLVITQDYGVAAMALGKKAAVLNQNGRAYTSDNIDQMLFERHLLKEARRSGKRIKGKTAKKRTSEQDIHFEQQLRKAIIHMLENINEN